MMVLHLKYGGLIFLYVLQCSQFVYSVVVIVVLCRSRYWAEGIHIAIFRTRSHWAKIGCQSQLCLCWNWNCQYWKSLKSVALKTLGQY
ncbi:hypothetical protein VIGAN_02104400 [Vigna angularis var. angularis]|uniref:Uncharacterized protein n=1 Tax=Vigna angularis var. angularis TaxID=157739 RepID=A0A0S3RCS7_PHAAN|nr:hypothetical protein VIGAN_02104400 [Vigna angularis var. angularis]